MSNRWWWPWNILKYFSRTRHGGLDCPDAVSYKSLLLPRLASWSWMLWRSWLWMLGLLLWSLHRGSCRGKDACQLNSRLYLSMRCEWILEMLTNYFFPSSFTPSAAATTSYSTEGTARIKTVTCLGQNNSLIRWEGCDRQECYQNQYSASFPAQQKTKLVSFSDYESYFLT